MKKLFSLLLLAAAASATAQDMNGTWNGTLSVNAALKLTMVLNINHDASGNETCTLDVIEQGATGIDAGIRHTGRDSIAIDIPVIGASYQGCVRNDTIHGTFKQRGMSFPVDFIHGKAALNRPQTPQPPFPYTTEEVAFHNDEADATLSATLTLPHCYGKGESCPVVIMVSGSGLQNRDEELFGHKPFLVIADRLARNGIATLRYDDRGCGKSTGDAAQATSEDFMKDAAAGIEWLRGQGKRFSSVGVLGHSEGAMIAFMLAAKGKADFIVSLAAPAVKGDTIIAGQINAKSEHYGQSAIVSASDIRKQILATGGAWERFFIDYDPADDIAATACPVMAANGSKDTQVVPELNFSVIREKLPKNPKSLLREYEGLNHLFQHCSTGYSEEYAHIEETLSEDVMEDICEWIKGL